MERNERAPEGTAMQPLAAIILAAGQGTRMKSATPKVLHRIGNRPMLHHVMLAAREAGAQRFVTVTGSQAPQVGDAAVAFDPKTRIAVQDPPQGTGHAVQVALPELGDFEGVVLILYADTPLMTAATLRRLASLVEEGADLAVLGFEAREPGAYGRLIVDGAGSLERIVEARDATKGELAITHCNSGVMAVNAARLRQEIPQIGNDNAKGEYYLTDIVEQTVRDGGRVGVVLGDEAEVQGVNDRVELASADRVFQKRRRADAMRSGVTLSDPDTVYFSHDTELSQDVVVGPGVVFGPGVSVEAGAVIEAYSHLEGCRIGSGASIGPFARIRPGTQVGSGAKVGNFVETKKVTLGDGAKVSHLTYLGDAVVGARANIGAGTITCNYDGYDKHTTRIGDGAFIGSNSALVAPVSIGNGAYIGSGSVVTKDVPDDALAVARGRQVVKDGWAVRYRSGKQT
jgi:bifunctional UDP-N-acetylglucosamine pyrophosphorylase/glucosamine-1-phosphate N-acetyltransferase